MEVKRWDKIRFWCLLPWSDQMAKNLSAFNRKVFISYRAAQEYIWASTSGRIEFAELNHSDWISVEFQRRNHCSNRKWRRNQEPPGDQERQAVRRGKLHLQTFHLTICFSQTVRHWRWGKAVFDFCFCSFLIRWPACRHAHLGTTRTGQQQRTANLSHSSSSGNFQFFSD